jgi:hypothetical protein
MIADNQLVALQIPKKSTSTGITGSWVDLQGYITDLASVKGLIFAGVGTTPGTCGGYIRQSDSSTGASPTSLYTFGTLTSAGGSAEAHFVITKRYVNFMGTVQSGKDMLLSAALILKARYTP